MNAPEWIWMVGGKRVGWGPLTCDPSDGEWTRYLRADLAATREAELQAEIARLAQDRLDVVVTLSRDQAAREAAAYAAGLEAAALLAEGFLDVDHIASDFNARPCDAQDARLAAMFAAVDPVALAAALKAEGGEW